MEAKCEQECETIEGGVCGEAGWCMCNPPLKEKYFKKILMLCYHHVSRLSLLNQEHDRVNAAQTYAALGRECFQYFSMVLQGFPKEG